MIFYSTLSPQCADVLRQQQEHYNPRHRRSRLNTIVFYEVCLHKATNPGPFSLPKFPDVLQIWPFDLLKSLCLPHSQNVKLIHVFIIQRRGCMPKLAHFLSLSVPISRYSYSLSSFSFSFFLPLSLILPCSHEDTLFLLGLMFLHKRRSYNEPCL